MSIFLPFPAVTGRHLDYLKNTNGGLTKMALEGRSFALGYGHAVQEYRAPRGRPIAQWLPMFDALGQHEMEAIYARLVERHGEAKAKRIAYSNRNLLIFPNLVINGIMAITIRTFYPTAPNQMMVNGWALAPNEESELARKYQLYNFLEFLGPDGFATPDDVEALESCQNCSRDHHNLVLVLVLVLVQGAVPGLRRVGFELENDAELERAFEHFQSRGLAPRRLAKAEAQALKQGPTFRVSELHCGLTFEFYGSTTVLARAYEPTVAKIGCISHVVIGSANFAGTQQSLTADFGFQVSDVVEDRFSFLRCFPNPFHHAFAVAAAAESHLHPINFIVTDIDDVGRAFRRMRQNDVKIAFGIGRHPPSGSVFLYFYDPDGMTVECSFGIEEFPEVGAREPRRLEPVPESLDTWGAVPDAMIGKFGAISGMSAMSGE